jgi:hypothetical protein
MDNRISLQYLGDVIMVATKKVLSRRRLLKAARSAVTVSLAAPIVMAKRAGAQRKTLKIMEWKHFVPSYNDWFKDYIKEWGGQERYRGRPGPYWNK